MANQTFGECLYDVMCRPTAVHAQSVPVQSVRLVTRVVHDATCQRSAMWHGMVTDMPCMVHMTFTEKG